MKRVKVLFLVMFAMLFAVSGAMAADGCTTIQSGSIVNKYNEVVTVGFDDWGYNYEAHSFNGRYCDAYRNGAYCDVDLQMKWNDAWISNKDCTNDGLLDRHFGYTTYIGSGAWLTNHQSGKVDVNGKLRQWTYFSKIVAVEPTDVLVGTNWVRDGVVLGPIIWNEFAIVEQISNDPSLGEHGVIYKSAINPGLGTLN